MNKIGFYLLLASLIPAAAVAVILPLPYRLRTRSNLLIMVISSTVWLYSEAVLRVLPYHYIDMVGRVKFAAVAIIPAAALALAIDFYYPARLRLTKFCYLPALFFTVAIAVTRIIIDFPVPTGFTISYLYGPGIWLFFAWVTAALGVVAYLVFINQNNKTILTRTHNRTILYTISVVAVMFLITHIILPYLFNVKILQPLAKVSTIAGMLFFLFTISRRRPADPLVQLQNGIVYGTICAVTMGIIYLNSVLVTGFFGRYISSINNVIILFTSGIILAGYMPLYNVLHRISETLLLRKFRYYQELQQVSDSISELRDLDRLGTFVVNEIQRLMQLSYASLYIHLPEKNLFRCSYHAGPIRDCPPVAETGELIRYLQETHRVVVADEVRQTSQDEKLAIRAVIDMVEAEAIVPIERDGYLNGFFVLGAKNSGDSFTREDTGILVTLANHMSIALHNSHLFHNLERKASRLGILDSLQKQIIYSTGKNELFNRLLDEIVINMEASEGCLLIAEPGGEFRLEVSGAAHGSVPGDLVTFDASVMENLRKGEPLTSSHIERVRNVVGCLPAYTAREWVLMPLMDNRDLMGAVVLGNETGFLENLDLEMLRTYANFTGNVIKNYSLYHSVQDARRFSESIFSAINSIVFSCTCDGTIVSTNRAGADELGLVEKTQLPATDPEYQQLSSIVMRSLQSLTHENNTEIAIRGKEYTLTTRFISGDLNDSDKNIIVIMNDITEISRLKKELLHRERIIAVARMASVIVQEVRNPLASIQSLVNQVPQRHAEQDFVELFSEIVPRDLDRINALMEDLLELTRDRAIERNPIDLLPILREHLESFIRENSFPNVQVRLNTCPTAVIQGDKKKLSQVLQNILQNAFESMKEGGVLTVVVKEQVKKQRSKKGPLVLVRVEDTGAGMDSQTMTSLFKPFFTTKDGGAGLGLAVAKKIVEDHGGTIEVQSEPGMGSRFDVFLPHE